MRRLLDITVALYVIVAGINAYLAGDFQMTVTFVRWKDACTVEAADTTPRPAVPELSELCEVGFLLAENDEAVLIGMESQADDTRPGRWRLNIPKVNIIERRDVDIDKAFPARRRRNAKT